MRNKTKDSLRYDMDTVLNNVLTGVDSSYVSSCVFRCSLLLSLFSYGLVSLDLSLYRVAVIDVPKLHAQSSLLTGSILPAWRALCLQYLQEPYGARARPPSRSAVLAQDHPEGKGTPVPTARACYSSLQHWVALASSPIRRHCLLRTSGVCCLDSIQRTTYAV